MLSGIGANLLRCYETSVEDQRVRDRDTRSIGRHLGDIGRMMLDVGLCSELQDWQMDLILIRT